MAHYLAGVARTDITPPVGIAHAGWGAQTHQRATGVDLPLWATALALGDGDETVVIVDIDLVYLWENEAEATLAAITALTGLPRAHIRLSYTHTHSGPVNGESWSSWVQQGAEMVPPYDASLPHRIAGIAWQATQQMRPVRIATGCGEAHIGVNRRFQRPEDQQVIVGRNTDGPIDPTVDVIRIDALDGSPLAAVVGYACHPITVGPDCDQITPDYPGVTKRVVEASTGATCLFLQGACGDIGPIRGVAKSGLNEYKRLGAILGHEASRVWWQLDVPARRPGQYEGTLESGAPLAIYADDILVPDPTPKLHVLTADVALPLKSLPDPAHFKVQLDEHVTRLNDLRQTEGDPHAIREETMLAKRAGMRYELSHQLAGQTQRTLTLQAIAIGDAIALLAMPGEPFVEIGAAVKAASTFQHTVFSGYSNVGWAYIPTADAYPLGGYEVDITPFASQAAAEVVTASQSLLNRLYQSVQG
jgi:neutral ceramidase